MLFDQSDRFDTHRLGRLMWRTNFLCGFATICCHKASTERLYQVSLCFRYIPLDTWFEIALQGGVTVFRANLRGTISARNARR